MRSNRYVFDNNIWISYFITNQQDRIINIIDVYEIEVFICDELIKEFETVLKHPHLKKFNIDVKKSIKILKAITTNYKLVYPIKNYIPDDVDDNYVVALALQTNAGFVTSGDKHILSQKVILEQKFTKLKIITKAAFEKKFHV
jgi:putative PIN family toxin of toxin-antitoxin system